MRILGSLAKSALAALLLYGLMTAISSAGGGDATVLSIPGGPTIRVSPQQTGKWMVEISGADVVVVVNEKTVQPSAPPSAPAASAPDRPYGSCDMGGQNDMRWAPEKGFLDMPWVATLQANGGNCHIQAGPRGGVVQVVGGPVRLNPGEHWFRSFTPGDRSAGAAFQSD